MYANVVNVVNAPTEKPESMCMGCNKAGTSCTVKACKAPRQSDCVIN